VGLRNLHTSSVSRLGGRRECKQLSLERIFLKKDLQAVLGPTFVKHAWRGLLVKSLNVKMAVAVHYAYQSSRLIYFQPHAASQVYIERLFSVCRDVVAGKHSRMTSSRERRASLSESWKTCWFRLPSNSDYMSQLMMMMTCMLWHVLTKVTLEVSR